MGGFHLVVMPGRSRQIRNGYHRLDRESCSGKVDTNVHSSARWILGQVSVSCAVLHTLWWWWCRINHSYNSNRRCVYRSTRILRHGTIHHCGCAAWQKFSFGYRSAPSRDNYLKRNYPLPRVLRIFLSERSYSLCGRHLLCLLHARRQSGCGADETFGSGISVEK